MRNYKISFATVSMNRLHHLKETLSKNILDNSDYPDLEFVLLDYNSKDGMENWIRDNYSSELESGKIKFFRTNVPEFFNRSHSRNMAFNLCSGDIFCNVDADNFTGPGFAEYLNKEFNNNKDIIVNSNFDGEYFKYKDAFGRFGAWKSDFHAVGGYDESMTSYGYEDIDLYDRICLLGRSEVKINNFGYLKSISHSNEERLEQEFFSKNLKKFFVAYDVGCTRFVFLYKNNLFESGTIKSDGEFYGGLYTIDEGEWDKGKWNEEESRLTLDFSNGNTLTLITEDRGLCYNLKDGQKRLSFFPIRDERFIENVKAQYSLVTNVSRYKRNMMEKRKSVNPDGYGKGVIFENFSKEPVMIKGHLLSRLVKSI